MRKHLRLLGVGLMIISLVLCSESFVTAATFSIDLVDGDWANATPVSLATINNSGTGGGLSTARWGTGAQSGYDFNSRPTPFDAESDGTAFALGTFTHLNFPITAGTAITSIDLLLTVADLGIFNVATTFNFQHNETPNTGGTPQSNDIVTIANPIVNQEFNSGAQNYYFNLFGFSQDGGTTLSTTFSTIEGQANNAVLYARITEAPVPGVPEPSTLLLLGFGLAGVGLYRRTKK